MWKKTVRVFFHVGITKFRNLWNKFWNVPQQLGRPSTKWLLILYKFRLTCRLLYGNIAIGPKQVLKFEKGLWVQWFQLNLLIGVDNCRKMALTWISLVMQMFKGKWFSWVCVGIFLILGVQRVHTALFTESAVPLFHLLLALGFFGLAGREIYRYFHEP